MSEVKPSTSISRRSLLGLTARGVGAAALAILGVTLWRRNGAQTPSDACARSGICRGCGQVARCPRPEAMSYRQAAEPREHQP